MGRKFLVTVNVSIRPIGGPVKYAAVGYEDEDVTEGTELKATARRLAEHLIDDYVATFGNTILARLPE